MQTNEVKMKKEDMRTIRTKKALREALKELIKRETFEKITVSDICKEAYINRVTFYTHYPDKYALLNDLLSSIITKNDNEIKEWMKTHHTNTPLVDFTLISCRSLCKTCHENRDIIKSLGNQENSMLVAMIEDLSERQTIRVLEEAQKYRTLNYPPVYVAKFIMGGLSKVIFEWATASKEIPEDIFFSYLEKAVRSCLQENILFE